MRSILFYLGPIPIRAYGFMLWLGLVIALIRTLRAGKRSSMTSGQIMDIAFYAVISGVIFAHLTSIMLDMQVYFNDPKEIINLWKHALSPSGGLKGLSFHGGFAGAVLVVWLYTRRKGLEFLHVADIFAPGLAIGYAVTRIGCFLNGCCYGMPTDLPWGVRFILDPATGQTTLPSHPVQLYASAAGLLIYLVLVYMEKRKRCAGQVFFSFVGMYAVYRFLAEFLRKGVTAEVFCGGLTEAQWVSILMLIVSVCFFLAHRSEDASTEEAKIAETHSENRR